MMFLPPILRQTILTSLERLGYGVVRIPAQGLATRQEQPAGQDGGGDGDGGPPQTSDAGNEETSGALPPKSKETSIVTYETLYPERWKSPIFNNPRSFWD